MAEFRFQTLEIWQRAADANLRFLNLRTSSMSNVNFALPNSFAQRHFRSPITLPREPGPIPTKTSPDLWASQENQLLNVPI